MEQNYTSNLFLKYLYRETSLTETLELEFALEDNKELKADFLKVKSGYSALPKVLFYPTEETVADILAYSSKSAALDLSC